MRTRLNLKGNELMCYALIYGFCQDKETRFKGSLSYISDWLGCTKPSVINTIKSLINKGFIIKYPYEINNVIFNEYSVNFDVVGDDPDNSPKDREKNNPQSKNFTGGSKKTLLPIDNIKDNIYTPNGGLNENVFSDKKEAHVKPKQKTKSSPKREPSIVTKARSVFEEYFKRKTGEDYYWVGKDAVQMKNLINQLKFSRNNKGLSNEDDDIMSALQVFLEKITDAWVLRNLSVPNISCKYNELVSQARGNTGKIGMILHDNTGEKYLNQRIKQWE